MMTEPVPFNLGNLMRCRCPECPVQAKSECAMGKLKKMKEGMDSFSDQNMPAAEDVPGVYCANGVAVCQDLDPSQSCICGSCSVWKDYGLAEATPSMYFCQNGSAE